MTSDDHHQKLLQAQKLEALGRFAGGIAHDFNNILSIIEGYAHAAVKRLQSGTLTPEYLQKILISTRRGAGLTHQLLAFSRQKVESEETVDICDVLRRQQVLLLPLLGETIKLVMDLPETPCYVSLTEDQATQVLLNLALNARDAMAQGGEFRISCTEKDGIVRLDFTDTGFGIAPEVLPCIFDPFFTTKERGRGTGLGLSVVYGIVDHAGGKINVRSQSKEGTTFLVELPAVAGPSAQVAPEEDSFASRLKGKTIMIAEDEPELRGILTVMLSDMEMKVLEASNGNQAMQVQDDYDGEIDFLLTDVVMPEMDGVRLGRLFAERRPESNVIYMSGYPFLKEERTMEVPESAFFISKPMQEDTIRQVLERALQRRDARLKVEKPPK